MAGGHAVPGFRRRLIIIATCPCARSTIRRVLTPSSLSPAHETGDRVGLASLVAQQHHSECELGGGLHVGFVDVSDTTTLIFQYFMDIFIREGLL